MCINNGMKSSKTGSSQIVFQQTVRCEHWMIKNKRATKPQRHEGNLYAYDYVGEKKPQNFKKTIHPVWFQLHVWNSITGKTVETVKRSQLQGAQGKGVSWAGESQGIFRPVKQLFHFTVSVIYFKGFTPEVFVFIYGYYKHWLHFLCRIIHP